MNKRLKAMSVGEFTWRRLFRSLILVPAIAVSGTAIIAMVFSERMIFQPQKAMYRDGPDIIKLETTDGERISAKFYEHPDAEFTILFSHGNAEDIGSIEPFVRRLSDAGFNVLVYDYRGYGTSEGSPSEQNAYEDISTAYDFLIDQKRINPNRIILHGRSLGGAVAAHLASREDAAGLVLESTFTSAFRVITRIPILPFDRFETLDILNEVRSPVLVIHGTEDRTINIHHGRQLFEAANEPKQAFWVEGAGHNDLFYREDDRYLKAIRDFAETLPK